METAAGAVVATVMIPAPVPAAPPAIVGRTFPSVAGRSLAGESVRIPEAAAGLRAAVASASTFAAPRP